MRTCLQSSAPITLGKPEGDDELNANRVSLNPASWNTPQTFRSRLSSAPTSQEDGTLF